MIDIMEELERYAEIIEREFGDEFELDVDSVWDEELIRIKHKKYDNEAMFSKEFEDKYEVLIEIGKNDIAIYSYPMNSFDECIEYFKKYKFFMETERLDYDFGEDDVFHSYLLSIPKEK